MLFSGVRDSNELIMSYDYIDETRSVRTHIKYFLGYTPDKKSGVNCLMTLSMGAQLIQCGFLEPRCKLQFLVKRLPFSMGTA